MFDKTYEAGAVSIRVRCEEEIRPSDFFPLFRADTAAADYTVTVTRGPLPPKTGKPVFETARRSRYTDGETVWDYVSYADAARLCHVPYARVARLGNALDLTVDYPRQFWERMIFDALNVQDLFLEKNAPIVHAALADTRYGGLLFAGPKGAGKSTQAELWQERTGARVLNGDRASLVRAEGVYYARGVPFCGSSRICVNDGAPVRCVVFPEKGKDNTILRLSAFDAFKRLIGCISYTRCDAALSAAALRAAENAAAGIPCYLFRCTKDYRAVDALAQALDDR